MADDPDPPPVLDYVRSGQPLSRGTRRQSWEAAKLSVLVVVGMALLLPAAGLLVVLLAGLGPGLGVTGTTYFCCGLPAVVGSICLQYGVRGLNQLFRPNSRSID